MTGLRRALNHVVFALGFASLGAELGFKADWALILGLLGLSSGVFLRIGSLEGRIARVEDSVSYIRSRLDNIDHRLSETREDISSLCATRSSKPS